jgi:hypothetical protein
MKATRWREDETRLSKRVAEQQGGHSRKNINAFVLLSCVVSQWEMVLDVLSLHITGEQK